MEVGVICNQKRETETIIGLAFLFCIFLSSAQRTKPQNEKIKLTNNTDANGKEERNKKKKTEVTKVLFKTVFTLLSRNVQHELFHINISVIKK